MPNRVLRDWTDSEAVDILSVYAERFFTRLIMKVDDYGRISANPKILKGNLFILKDDVREADISSWMDECHNAGLILLYEVNLKKYIQIENFKQTLRQKVEKHPPPTCIADAKQMLSNGIADATLLLPEKKGNETKPKTEVEGNNNIFFEFFRRVSGKHISDGELLIEVAKFQNRYPNIHPNTAGALINTWVANIGRVPVKSQNVSSFI